MCSVFYCRFKYVGNWLIVSCFTTLSTTFQLHQRVSRVNHQYYCTGQFILTTASTSLCLPRNSEQKREKPYYNFWKSLVWPVQRSYLRPPTPKVDALGMWKRIKVFCRTIYLTPSWCNQQLLCCFEVPYFFCKCFIACLYFFVFWFTWILLNIPVNTNGWLECVGIK